MSVLDEKPYDFKGAVKKELGGRTVTQQGEGLPFSQIRSDLVPGGGVLAPGGSRSIGSRCVGVPRKK